MCLAIPARIVALNGLEATVDLGGVRKRNKLHRRY